MDPVSPGPSAQCAGTPAIDRDARAIDVGGGWRAEKGDHRRHFRCLAEAFGRHLLGCTTDHLEELTYESRKRVHNLKYYTWVEQQGRTYDEIQAQWYDPAYWTDIQKQAPAIDALITEFNARVGLLK